MSLDVSLTGVFGDIPESYSALSIFSGSKSSIKGDLPSFLTVSTDVDTSNVDTSTRFLCYEVSNILTSKACDLTGICHVSRLSQTVLLLSAIPDCSATKCYPRLFCY